MADMKEKPEFVAVVDTIREYRREQICNASATLTGTTLGMFSALIAGVDGGRGKKNRYRTDGMKKKVVF